MRQKWQKLNLNTYHRHHLFEINLQQINRNLSDSRIVNIEAKMAEAKPEYVPPPPPVRDQKGLK